jgi:disulfide bond formation protein DsbB
MDVRTASLFFALLALLCLAATAVVAVLGLVRLASRGSLGEVRVELGRAAVPLAWLVALVTTLGSLYYSEVQGFIPCKLCWLQRICMYPLAVILGIAAFRRDRDIRFYVLPITVVGIVISSYHSWIQAYPPEGGTSFCTVDAPCTERYVWEFGFVSLPFMALCAFLFVTSMMLMARPPAEERDERDDELVDEQGADAGEVHGASSDQHDEAPAPAGVRP